MKPPPEEWFNPDANTEQKEQNVKKESDNSPRESRATPDWLRLLEVYSFLFDAHKKQ
tara:strand:- start:6975 stop:7145 length:171 start_codon:yes stop_codon:yes gene_type:complete